MQALPPSVVISPDALSQELDGETVILHLNSERYYVLDDVGTRMWQLLTSLGDPAAVCAQLLEEYDVDEERLRADLGTLIEQLAAAGMLEVK